MTDANSASPELATPRPAAGGKRCWGVWIVALITAIAAAGVYSRSLSGGFVFDDVPAIQESTYIHDTGNWLKVLTFYVMSEDVLDFNRPVQVASLMLDATIWGVNPMGYRLTSLLLHALCTALVVLLLAKLLRESDSSSTAGGMDRPMLAGLLLAGLLFALHPVMVEAAAVPSNRKDQLATLFFILSLLTATGFRANGSPRDWVLGFACVMCMLMSIGAKENGVAGPAVLFMYWWLLRRKEHPAAWVSLIALCSLVVVVFLAVRFGLERDKSEVFLSKPSPLSPTLKGRANFQVGYMVFYAKNLVWPTALCADYTPHSLLPILKLGLLRDVIFIALGGAGIWLAMRSRHFALALWVVVFALLPVCNLVPIYIHAADRYLYMPMVGLAMMVALGVSVAGRKWSIPLATAGFAGGLALCVVMGVMTWQRIAVWDNAMSLWTDTRAKNEYSIRALMGLGTEYMANNEFDKALPCWELAAEWVTNRPDFWINLVFCHEKLGNTQGMNDAIMRMLKVHPNLLRPETLPREGYLKGVNMNRFTRIMGEFRQAHPYYTPPPPMPFHQP